MPMRRSPHRRRRSSRWALGSDWISVGLDGAFVWRLPLLNEPPRGGHHYVLELTRDPITRAMQKGVADAVGRIDASLKSLSRVDRNETLRRALRGANASLLRLVLDLPAHLARYLASTATG